MQLTEEQIRGLEKIEVNLKFKDKILVTKADVAREYISISNKKDSFIERAVSANKDLRASFQNMKDCCLNSLNEIKSGMNDLYEAAELTGHKDTFMQIVQIKNTLARDYFELTNNEAPKRMWSNEILSDRVISVLDSSNRALDEYSRIDQDKLRELESAVQIILECRAEASGIVDKNTLIASNPAYRTRSLMESLKLEKEDFAYRYSQVVENVQAINSIKENATELKRSYDTLKDIRASKKVSEPEIKKQASISI